MKKIEPEIRRFVSDNFLYGQDDSLQNSDSFMKKGIIDSMGTMELVSFLEQKFRIRIEDRELVPENLDSINNLLAFVEKKTTVAA